MPAIIHNGDYYLIDMPVYEDGTIDCWGRVALNEVERKFQEDWLAISVPDGTENTPGIPPQKINALRP
jgi:hypothetical protein